MNQVQLDWQVACQENTTKSYYRFLKNHPDTPYTEEAKTCIEEAKEKRVFEECVKECSMRRYLKRYPQGKLLQEALEYKEKFKKREYNSNALYFNIIYHYLGSTYCSVKG